MPKLKTRKSFSKRFKATAKGKFKHGQAGKGHILTKKSRKRKRALRRNAIMDGSVHQTLRALMPYA